MSLNRMNPTHVGASVVPFTSFCNWGSFSGLVRATGLPALASFAQLRLTARIVV